MDIYRDLLRPTEPLYVEGIASERLDPRRTLDKDVYEVPLRLSRALTEFEKGALSKVGMPGQHTLQDDVLLLWATNLEKISALAPKIVSALEEAANRGEVQRSKVAQEKRRLQVLAEGLQERFTIARHEQGETL